jgi:hypothetical protein
MYGSLLQRSHVKIVTALTMAAQTECKASLRKYCGRVNDPEILRSWVQATVRRCGPDA